MAAKTYLLELVLTAVLTVSASIYKMFEPVNFRRHSNDRFIPHRMDITLDLFNKEITTPIDVTKDGEFVNYAKIRYNQQIYENTLRNVLLPLEVKVLNFFPPKKFQPKEYAVLSNPKWPVHARKKPVIGPPELILDMPQFDSHICHHVADWSSKNCLGTVFENEVHMWYPDEELLRDATTTQKRVQHCVKWKQDGMRFGVGLFPNKLGIWDTKGRKLICETSCCMFCEVFALEWINDKYLVSGCSRGFLNLYSPNLTCLKKERNSQDDIVSIVASGDQKMMAVSSMDKMVTIWEVPEMKPHFKIRCQSVIRALAFHPWKCSTLAIGHGNEDCRVILWNVNTYNKIASEQTAYKNSSIDALSFNPISGELVVSYYVQVRDRGTGIVGVLSSIDTVVEELHSHNGPIPYLLWGRGGKLLASASADENLCIWEFFGGPHTKQKKERVNSSSTILSRSYIR